MCNTVNTFVISLKNLLTDKGLSIPPDNSQSGLYTLQIPEYQRPYTWTAKQVMQLLDDVVRFSEYPDLLVMGKLTREKESEIAWLIMSPMRLS